MFLIVHKFDTGLFNFDWSLPMFSLFSKPLIIL